MNLAYYSDKKNKFENIALINLMKKDGIIVNILKNTCKSTFKSFEKEYDCFCADIKTSNTEFLYYIRNLRKNNPKLAIVIIKQNLNLIQKLDYYYVGSDLIIDSDKNIKEIFARIKATIRSYKKFHKTIEFNNLEINLQEKYIKYKNQLEKITKKEKEILNIFTQNPNRAYTKTELLNLAWNDKEKYDRNIINVYLYRLRKKFKNIYKKEVIETVKGFGYRLKIN